MERTDYITGTALQLDLWGSQLAALEREVTDGARQRSDALRLRLRRLRKRSRALRRRVLEAAHGGPATDWDDVRLPLERAVRDFRSLATEVYDDVRGA